MEYNSCVVYFRRLSLRLFSPLVLSLRMAQYSAGQALDNVGKNIRYKVESEIARGQITAQEREVLGRVMRRIEWDVRIIDVTPPASTDTQVVVPNNTKVIVKP